jgi:hypothetical protein
VSSSRQRTRPLLSHYTEEEADAKLLEKLFHKTSYTRRHSDFFNNIAPLQPETSKNPSAFRK